MWPSDSAVRLNELVRTYWSEPYQDSHADMLHEVMTLLLDLENEGVL